MEGSPGSTRYPIDIHRTSLGYMISQSTVALLGSAGARNGLSSRYGSKQAKGIDR